MSIRSDSARRERRNLAIAAAFLGQGLSERGSPNYSYKSNVLALFLRELKSPPDTLERISWSCPAGVSLINRSSQSGKFRLKLLFLALQCSQGRANHLAGVFVPATVDLRQHEVVKFLSQIHIPGGHC